MASFPAANFGIKGKGKADVSTTVQEAVDSVSNAGGGKLIIPKGNFKFSNIKLKSNVHIRIASGTKIEPVRKGGSFNVFELGRETAPIENVSVRGVGGKFIVAIPSSFKKGRAFILARVTNFYIANVRVEDKLADFCSISLVPGGDPGNPEKNIAFSKQGTIEDVTVENARSGFGLVQIHAADTVHIRNIYSIGGVVLRVETGLTRMNDNQKGGAHNIVAENISGKDCNSGVLFSPHSMNNGVVKVTKVRTKGCGFGARVAKGFVSKKQTNQSLKAGSFAKGSFIKDVTATFGTNAQIEKKHFRYMAEELLRTIDQSKSEDGKKSFRGPSIAAVANVTLREDATFAKVREIGFTFKPFRIIQYKPRK